MKKRSLKKVSRREFLAVTGAAGVSLLLPRGTSAVPAGKKTFTILHTNDMHSAFIGMGPAADYTPFTLNDDGEMVAARYLDWKLVWLENRGEAFGVWREPFVELRIPLLFNLRRDPFEKAQHNSNTYNDWFLDRPFVIVPMTEMAGKFLKTMIDYPPSATAGSFNLSKMQKQIEALGQAE